MFISAVRGAASGAINHMDSECPRRCSKFDDWFDAGLGGVDELRTLFFDRVEQVKHSHAQSIRHDLNRIECRVGLTVFDAAEIGLIEPTLLAKHHLAHASFQPQRANAQAEPLSKGIFHTQNYVAYALIHIHTNSYRLGANHGVDRRHLFGYWPVQGGG